MNPCPNEDTLQRLLQERLGEVDQQAIVEHVQTCPRCQEALAGLADSLEDLLPPGAGVELPRRLVPERGAADGLTGRLPQLPGYEVLGEIGRGGMGVVYKARHLKLNRIVALKMVLAGGYASESELVRFLGEAEAVAQLQHRNIVPVFETGQHHGLPYFTLEYVTGGSLADKVRAQPLPAAEAAQLVEQMSHGMAYAHQRGIVHRDLKPENVLLAEDGTPKVTDFGLAKRVQGGSGLTPTGAVLGTPSYMAPEQASGKSKELGPLADVYALGAVLYRLLTGRPPFQAATALDTILQVISDEPVPPTQLQPQVPRDLETICLQCLQKEPGKRYASAEELAEDLRRFLDGRPVRARPVRLPERVWKLARRHPVTAALTATIILAVATLVMTLAISKTWVDMALANETSANEQLKTANTDLKTERGNLAVANERKQEAITEARSNFYRTSLALAGREWQGQNIARMEQLLDQAPPEFRHWEWHFLKRQATPYHYRFACGAPVRGLAFSPDGTRLAILVDETPSDSTNPRLKVQVRDARDGTLVLSWAVVHPRDRLKFSDDGNLVFLFDDRGFAVHDVATGRELLSRTVEGLQDIVQSAKGEHIIACTLQVIVTWDAATGQEVRITPFPKPMPLAQIKLRTDGRVVAGYSYPLKAVMLFDAGTGAELARAPIDATPVAFSEDGQKLVCASNGERSVVYLIETATGKVLRSVPQTLNPLLGSHPIVRTAPAFFLGKALSRQRLENDEETFSLLARPWGSDYAISSFGWAAGAAGHDVQVWDVRRDPEVATIPLAGVPAVSVSPDKAYVLSEKPGQRVAPELVCASDTGKGLWSLPLASSQAQFSADGARVAFLHYPESAVKIHDVATGRLVQKLGFARRFTLNRNGTRIALQSSLAPRPQPDDFNEHSLAVVDLETANTLYRLTKRGHDWPARLLLSPDMDRLVLVPHEGAKPDATSWEHQVIEVGTGKVLCRFQAAAKTVTEMVFSPDGKMVAAFVSDADAPTASLHYWDTTTGKETIPTRGVSPPTDSITFTPDGGRFVNGRSGEWTIWDTASGREHRRIARPSGDKLNLPLGLPSFSQDGRRMLGLGSATSLTVWNLTDGQEVRSFPLSSAVAEARLTSDGKRVATVEEKKPADGEGIFRYRDVPTGQMLREDAFLYELLSGWGSLSPNGSVYLCPKSRERTAEVRLRNLATGQEVDPITVSEHITTVLGPNGLCCLGSGKEGAEMTLQIDRIEGGKVVPVARRTFASGFGSPVFSPDGKALAVTLRKGGLVLWDLGQDQVLPVAELPELGPRSDTFWQVRFRPDGRHVAVVPSTSREANRPCVTQVWDIESRTKQFELPAAEADEFYITYSPDSRWLATGVWPPVGGKMKLSLWSAETGSPGPLRDTLTEWCLEPAFSADGRFLAAPVNLGTVSGTRVWELPAGKEGVMLAGFGDPVAFSPDGKRLAAVKKTAGRESVSISLFDTASGQELLNLPTATPALRDVHFVAETGRLVAVGFREVRVWDGAVWEPEARRSADLPPPRPRPVPKDPVLPLNVPKNLLRLVEHTGVVLALGFSPDGDRLVTGDAKGARVWDAKTGALVRTLDVEGPILRAEFSADSRILTVGNKESAVRLWDAKDGQALPALPPRKAPVREAKFTPDGKQVVCLDETGTLTVFGLDGKEVTSFSAFDPKLVLNGLAVSPDGKRACAALGKGPEWAIKVWDVQAGKEASSWAASDKPVWGVAWSPEGKWIASAGVDQTVRVWQADTGKLHQTLTGGAKTVSRVAFHPDGGSVAAVSLDGTVRLWDVSTGKAGPVIPLEPPGNGTVAFSPDGGRLAATAPGIVHLWDLPAGPTR